jgi:hypothetical protein
MTAVKDLGIQEMKKILTEKIEAMPREMLMAMLTILSPEETTEVASKKGIPWPDGNVWHVDSEFKPMTREEMYG